MPDGTPAREHAPPRAAERRTQPGEWHQPARGRQSDEGIARAFIQSQEVRTPAHFIGRADLVGAPAGAPPLNARGDQWSASAARGGGRGWAWSWNRPGWTSWGWQAGYWTREEGTWY